MLRKYNTLSCLVAVLLCTISLCFTNGLAAQVRKADAFASYDLNLDQRKVKLTDLIEEVEFIQLEETSESLISTIDNLHVFEDKIVVTGNVFEGDIFVFDNNGRFVNRINKKGNGPEEYRSLRDVWIEDGLIALYEHGRSIKRYKLNGDFVSESKLILTPDHVIGKSGNYFYDMNRQPFGEGLKFSIVRLDNKLNVLDMHFPYTRVPNLASFVRVSPMFSHQESVGYYRPFTDTVYHFSKGKFKPLLHLEFGDNWHWDNNDPLSDNVIRELRLGVKVWSVTPTVGSRYVHTASLYGSTGKSRMDHLIDRNSSKIVMIDLNRSGEKSLYDLKVFFWESDNVFYAILPSLEAVSLVSEASARNWSFRGKTSLEKIASSENPVLMRITIKDILKK